MEIHHRIKADGEVGRKVLRTSKTRFNMVKRS